MSLTVLTVVHWNMQICMQMNIKINKWTQVFINNQIVKFSAQIEYRIRSRCWVRFGYTKLVGTTCMPEKKKRSVVINYGISTYRVEMLWYASKSVVLRGKPFKVRLILAKISKDPLYFFCSIPLMKSLSIHTIYVIHTIKFS